MFQNSKLKACPQLRSRIQNSQGVTLLELMVAVLLFSVTILMATQIFTMVIDGQRDAISAQNMQESMRYTFERMAKEIRMAQKSSLGSCAGSTINKIYEINPGGDQLTFLNRRGECITYRLSGGRIEIKRNAEDYQPITIGKIDIDSLEFVLTGSNLDDDQLMLTMRIDAAAETRDQFKHEMQIQTSISSRHYE